MRLPFPCWLAAASLLSIFCPSLDAQSFLRDVSLSGLGNGNPARPFGATYQPALDRLYVAVAGDVFFPNDVVAEIDPNTDQVVGTIQAGLFPEEVAFSYDLQGNPVYGAVTNSSSGTVTVWDAQTRAVVATVALPDPFGFGSCFPFGLIASDAHFYVSTVDGSGDVHAINLATLQYDLQASFNVGPKTGGRLLLDGKTLVVPTTRYTPSFTGAEGGVTGWHTGALPFFWERLCAFHEAAGVFPSGQDAVQLANGRLILGGLDFDQRLYVFEGAGILMRTLRLSQARGAQGLALNDPKSLLAVCDLGTNTLTLYDVLNSREYSVTNLGSVGQGYFLPNEALFAAGKLYVTCQGSEEVVVFDGLPNITPGAGYAGTITVSESTPFPGATVTVDLSGPGVVALLTAMDDQPGPFQGVLLDIGPNPQVAGFGAGAFSKGFVVPPNPALRGRNFFAQGVVDATGAQLVTEPRAAVIQ